MRYCCIMADDLENNKNELTSVAVTDDVEKEECVSPLLYCTNTPPPTPNYTNANLLAIEEGINVANDDYKQNVNDTGISKTIEISLTDNSSISKCYQTFANTIDDTTINRTVTTTLVNTLNRTINTSMTAGTMSISLNAANISKKMPPTSIKNILIDRNYVDEVQCLFEEKPEIFEKWLIERASSSAINRVQQFIDRRQRLTTKTCVSSDLFQQWMETSPIKKNLSISTPSVGNSLTDNRRHLRELDEGELFMELIRDVANELDIDVLCHKILVNVGLLTQADRGSLFLAKGPPNNRYLVAKLFDVTQKTPLAEAIKKANLEEIIIPFGVGIAGMVAQTKEIINIREAYNDSRFNSEIDQKTGYRTHTILSMPICNYEGDIIGVAEIINKMNGCHEFNAHDVEIFRRYLTFCGIGIQNAQLFEMSVQEYRRNEILLNLARSIFEEQNNLECLVTKIMTEARELLKCERCSVYLVDLDCGEASHLEKIIEKPDQMYMRQNKNRKNSDALEDKHSETRFTVLFELGNGNQSANISRPTNNDLNNSTLAQIAQFVANTGQTVNISDVRIWVRDHNQIRSENEIDSIHAILCMPIANAQKTVIGVAQLINKTNGVPFTETDASIFEAFAIFCGLGIHNTQMYENACKLMAKQKVALECLSYHATASQDQTDKLVADEIPSAETYNLYSFTFVDFELSDDDTCRAVVRMFLQCNLVQMFQIPYDVLCRWILSVRKNYRPVKYHNWRHALNVTQTMFAMLKTGRMERFMTDLEMFGLLVACLSHDLDHRGTNNAFQTKTESPLAILYTTSTMEHHHFDQCVMILNSEGNNIFQALSPDDYRSIMKVVENAILSTDLAVYFKKRNAFLELVENGEFDWQSADRKELLCGMMMTACDVSAIAKPWEVQHRVAKLVADEFFDQGDLEKLQLNTQPVAMMDRERKDELPKMQVGFIDVICLPLYGVLSDTFPWIKPLYEGTLQNRHHWQDLAEKVEMGLTWIDHDTIEKPIEEFAACTDEDIKDIEFTVTTLNCQPSNEESTAIHNYHHPRGISRLSIKKTGNLSKAVKSKITKTLYNSMDGVKMKSQAKLLDKHPSEEHEDKSANFGTFQLSNVTTCNVSSTTTITNTTTISTITINSSNITTTTTTIISSGQISNLATSPSAIASVTSSTDKNKKRSKFCSLL